MDTEEVCACREWNKRLVDRKQLAQVLITFINQKTSCYSCIVKSGLNSTHKWYMLLIKDMVGKKNHNSHSWKENWEVLNGHNEQYPCPSMAFLWVRGLNKDIKGDLDQVTELLASGKSDDSSSITTLIPFRVAVDPKPILGMLEDADECTQTQEGVLSKYWLRLRLRVPWASVFTGLNSPRTIQINFKHGYFPVNTWCTFL